MNTRALVRPTDPSSGHVEVGPIIVHFCFPLHTPASALAEFLPTTAAAAISLITRFESNPLFSDQMAQSLLLSTKRHIPTYVVSAFGVINKMERPCVYSSQRPDDPAGKLKISTKSLQIQSVRRFPPTFVTGCRPDSAAVNEVGRT